MTPQQFMTAYEAYIRRDRHRPRAPASGQDAESYHQKTSPVTSAKARDSQESGNTRKDPKPMTKTTEKPIATTKQLAAALKTCRWDNIVRARDYVRSHVAELENILDQTQMTTPGYDELKIVFKQMSDAAWTLDVLVPSR